MVQLYPGPIMVDFTAYVGYWLRGVPGALLATPDFVLPAFVLVVLLSAAYFSGGEVQWMHRLFLGLEALVIGIITNVTLALGQQALKGRVEVLIALAAFIALLFKISAILVPLAALALGAFAITLSHGAAPTPLAAAPSIRRLVAIAALADEDYRLAQGLTETHVGFFMHRHAMARQQPENFPLAYHDLAMAHHEAAEKLADAIPSQDLKKILPQLNNVLKACVACHLEYTLRSS